MRNSAHICFILFLIQVSCSPDYNIGLIGQPIAKTILQVEYDLSSQKDSCKIKWYVSGENVDEWKELPGIQSGEIVLLTSYVNKYIKCEVIVLSGPNEGETISVITESPVSYQGNPNTDWFQDAGVGLMVHFLKDNYVKEGASQEWNDVVDDFDVELFAQGCAEAGVGFVLFTLGQNDGYYCSPNAAYDSVVGIEPGMLCSKRDLPADLFGALDKKGIRLMLYLPGNPPIMNRLVTDKFQYTYGVDSPTSQYTQARWEAVISEWSIRYGEKLSGWWFDGMYRGGIIETRSDMNLKHNISTHTLAAKAGNFNSIVSYNYGIDKIQSNSPYDDYSAGEESRIIQLPGNRWVDDGVQWFHLTYLGDWWGAEGSRFSTSELVSWAKKVFEGSGVLCFDVHANKTGKINDDHLKQLAAVCEIFQESKQYN